MKKSTIRTEKRSKKFRLLWTYSILSYEHPRISAGLCFPFFLSVRFLSLPGHPTPLWSGAPFPGDDASAHRWNRASAAFSLCSPGCARSLPEQKSHRRLLRACKTAADPAGDPCTPFRSPIPAAKTGHCPDGPPIRSLHRAEYTSG